MSNVGQVALVVTILCLLVRVANGGEFASRGTENLDDGQARTAPPAPPVESRTVSVRINRPFRVVYQFLAAPENWNG